ncbi:DUF4258 domain-containing protein [Candidatus Woesearchaeota archaeon]|nr:DUF4258 domain-containing protein [Candidatus Woesearchaeota archaeon]
MKVVFTLHAEEQMAERKIVKQWVEEAIKQPDFIEKEGGKHYSMKKINSHLLKVVYVKENYIKVVTCYFIK